MRFEAVVFDLLTALLDSWTLWGRVAGDDGARWRRTCLDLIYATGEYRPYEDLVAESARTAGLDPALAGDLLARWDEVEPWPETPGVLRDLVRDHRLALVTNCSEELARRAADRIGVPVDALVSAEAAGYYKPRPEPYLRALGDLDTERALFVAGSAGDVPGAIGAGMPVVWHNRVGAPPSGGEPLAVIETLEPLPAIARAI
jgi:2-haloacid dehalogenase